MDEEEVIKADYEADCDNPTPEGFETYKSGFYACYNRLLETGCYFPNIFAPDL